MAFFDVTSDETQAVPITHVGNDPLEVMITGGFGSGDVTIQKLDTDGVWKDIPGALYTDVVSKIFNFKGPVTVRYVVANSTTPTLRIEFT